MCPEQQVHEVDFQKNASLTMEVDRNKEGEKSGPQIEKQEDGTEH